MAHGTVTCSTRGNVPATLGVGVAQRPPWTSAWLPVPLHTRSMIHTQRRQANEKSTSATAQQTHIHNTITLLLQRPKSSRLNPNTPTKRTLTSKGHYNTCAHFCGKPIFQTWGLWCYVIKTRVNKQSPDEVYDAVTKTRVKLESPDEVYDAVIKTRVNKESPDKVYDAVTKTCVKLKSPAEVYAARSPKLVSINTAEVTKLVWNCNAQLRFMT